MQSTVSSSFVDTTVLQFSIIFYDKVTLHHNGRLLFFWNLIMVQAAFAKPDLRIENFQQVDNIWWKLDAVQDFWKSFTFKPVVFF